MAKKWTLAEQKTRRRQLVGLYVAQNLTIKEISHRLRISESGVYGRLIKLNIPTIRYKKQRYNNTLQYITLPHQYSEELAEFVGIMLGDGNINPTQVRVTINSNEREYITHITKLMKRNFNALPRVIPRKQKQAVDIYFGSTKVVRYLKKMGLVSNKIRDQVEIPKWINRSRAFQRACLRGVLDTDGSVYKLRFGMQISFTNKSARLLRNVQAILKDFHYHPSRITQFSLYLTQRKDLIRYFQEIGFSNPKHQKRFTKFIKLLGYPSLVNGA